MNALNKNSKAGKVNTTISREILFKEQLENLIKPELGDFLIQQNKIQTALMLIIFYRGASQGLLDKKLIKKLENSTLGALIDFYKLCAKQTQEEVELIRDLEKYNSLRNKLTHRFIEMLTNVKIAKFPSQENKREYLQKLNIKDALLIGTKIEPKLILILSRESLKFKEFLKN